MIHRTARLSSVIAGVFLAALTAFAQPTNRPVTPMPMPRPTADDAQAIIKPGHEGMMNNFQLQGGDVDSIMGALQANTGRIVIHPANLPPGTYTINVDHPIPMKEFVLALETALFENGIAVIPMGNDFLKVVPITIARTEAPEYIDGSTLDLPPSGQLATKLFELKFLRASDLFAGPGGGLGTMLTTTIGGGAVQLPAQNAVLVTDTISNLQRIELLLKQIDRPELSGFTTKFYALQNSKASDVANKLHSILQGPLAAQIGTATTYNADDRTNQLIIITDPREVPFFDDLVSKLDMASASNTRSEVIFLQHADATTLSTMLTQVITGQVSAAQKANTGAPTTPGVTPTPTPIVRPGLPNLPGAAAALSESATAVFSPYATIVPDERSNSVVVSGTADDLRLVRDLIAKLDQALPQVRIQVIIAEVTLSDTDISGIQSLGLTVGTDTPANGGGHRGTHITGFGGTGGTGSDLNLSGWDITNGVVNPFAFNALFEASGAGARSRVHVLSAPVIVTAHNQKAEVTVGEQLPLINSTETSLASTGTTPVATESVSYTNIAIDLTVTPLIGSNGDIQMNIDQAVNTVIGETTVNGSPQPTIGHREAKSWVTVKDNQMIVLGGMQQTQKTESHNKIGLLYEIPILSQILGGHTDDLERTELLFFIRPHIISTDDETSDTQQRIQEMSNRDQINQFLINPTPQPESKTKNFLDRFKGDE